LDLDKLSIPAAINRILREEAKVVPAIRRQSAALRKVIGMVISAFRKRRRLLYVGAGTSGRLGILDASECPPTFGSDPEMVQGIIAGGFPAILRAQEGAEDSPAGGAAVMDEHNVGERDVVVGIAASGTTPFVHGAIERARERNARTA